MQPLWKKILKTPELYLGILIVALVGFFCVDQIGVKDVRLAEGDEDFQSSTLPITKKFTEPIRVSFTVNNPMGHRYNLRIVPDDCATYLEIDSNSVSLLGRTGICDYGNGFVLRSHELDSLGVRDGSQFLVAVKNNGGDGGLKVVIEKSASALVGFLQISLLVCVSLLALLIARRFKFGWGVALLLMLGVALRVGFDVTLPKYDKFGHDVDGHVAYVHYIAENYSIPEEKDCWTCYHPPVYYASSVPAWKISEVVGVPGVSALQVESLLLSMAFLFLGVAFLSQFMKGASLMVAVALFTFWPVIVLVAPRIGNDQMFYVLHMACLWGGVKYLNSGRGKFLLVASVATALSFWTKTTGSVTMGTFLLFAVTGYVLNCQRLSPSRSEIWSWFVFAVLLASIALDKLWGSSDLVGNASGLHSGLRVASETGNFFYFDLESFLTYPYTSPWHDEMGRQYFWNYTLKTSLFGEFKLLETAAGKFLATVISFSFLGMVVMAVRGFWQTRLKPVHWILVLQGAAFVAALAFLRNKIPYACSNDFRYILPSLMSFIPFVSLGINVEGASRKSQVMGYVLVAVFVVCSVVLMTEVALQ